MTNNIMYLFAYFVNHFNFAELLKRDLLWLRNTFHMLNDKIVLCKTDARAIQCLTFIFCPLHFRISMCDSGFSQPTT